MTKLGAALWFLAIAAALAFLLLRLNEGITLQSSILALLPHAERDTSSQAVQDRIAGAFSQRVAFLVGHADATKARAAALELSAALEQSGMVSAITSKVAPDAMRVTANAFFPYRTGLLSEPDRERLLDNDGKALVSRALSLLYGPGGFANSKLIANDPFMLLPAYFLAMPLAQTRLSPEDGVLSVRDGNKTFVLVGADLSGDPYALRFQASFKDLLSKTFGSLRQQTPDLTILRTGAIFYAGEGANQAVTETSIIGSASMVATLAMILLVFRGLRPIVLGFVAVAVGMLFAFVGTLMIFGEIHTVALLFGASLIGIAVDYSLEYFCEYFDPSVTDPVARLWRVLPALAIGFVTTLIGYATLLLAPFPGLQQVSAFSLIGLSASFLTVMLLYPVLDSKRPPVLNTRFVRLAAGHATLWEAPSLRFVRLAIIVACVAAGVAGALELRIDDDVRNLQSLSADLKRQEDELKRLTGWSPGTQYLLIRGDTEQAVLELEEKLAGPLSTARQKGFLAAFTTVAQFVPSIARQTENRELVRTRLIEPHLASYAAQIGYQGSFDYAAPAGFVTPADLPHVGALSLLATLNVGSKDNPVHIVLLQGVTDATAVRGLVSQFSDVRFVSLADDWSQLFGEYRRYAVALLALSALLMYPVLWWRYGWWGALQVLAPPVAAVVLAPPLAALAGVEFTFFNAMALVLVLSIGLDYSVFCRETTVARKPITMLAIALAALSTIWSFGLLAFSQVFAVYAFGMTMLIGTTLAYVFAPAAGRVTRAAP